MSDDTYTKRAKRDKVKVSFLVILLVPPCSMHATIQWKKGGVLCGRFLLGGDGGYIEFHGTTQLTR